MKRALIGLVLMLVAFQTAAGAQTSEQPAWVNVVASVDFEDTPMGGILGTLEKAAGFSLQMDKDLIPELESRVTIRIQHTAMGEILSSLLSTRNLRYKVIGAKTVEIVRQ